MSSLSATVERLALPVFAFYMLVACNFVKEVTGCGLQTVLDGNMFAKHALAFLLLFFLVVLASPDTAGDRIVRNLLVSAAVYAWFVVTTRCNAWITLVVLALLLASYVASLSKRHNDGKDDAAARRAARAQRWLALAALAVSAAGFLLYVVEKRREYGRDFTWTRFFSGNLHCRRFTPEDAKLSGVFGRWAVHSDRGNGSDGGNGVDVGKGAVGKGKPGSEPWFWIPPNPPLHPLLMPLSRNPPMNMHF